ncbi:MAG: XRE family transcriptional regulator [Gallionellaceae bacterium]|nr:MAG: XRE family transcriptional regulator [Gallionellaceae bacterium]
MLDKARPWNDLRVQPASRIGAMKADRESQLSIRINEIVLGKRGITADTALRLAKVFGTSAQFWMGLQDEYELREARSQIKEQLKQMLPLAA